MKKNISHAAKSLKNNRNRKNNKRNNMHHVYNNNINPLPPPSSNNPKKQEQPQKTSQKKNEHYQYVQNKIDSIQSFLDQHQKYKNSKQKNQYDYQLNVGYQKNKLKDRSVRQHHRLQGLMNSQEDEKKQNKKIIIKNNNNILHYIAIGLLIFTGVGIWRWVQFQLQCYPKRSKQRLNVFAQSFFYIIRPYKFYGDSSDDDPKSLQIK